MQTILLADDNALLLTALSIPLTRLGYDVKTAPDGNRLLEAYAALQEPPFAIVTDMEMRGGLDGVGAAKQLRENGYTAGRLILMSGNPGNLPRYAAMHGLTEDQARAMFDLVLEKPFSYVVLMEALTGPLQPSQR